MAYTMQATRRKGKMTKKEIIASIFREFNAKGMMDSDNLHRALDELDHSSNEKINTLWEIVTFTRDNWEPNG